MNAVSNFESVAAELIRIAPTEKAATFARKVADQVRARGAEWIESNVHNLKIESSSEDQYFPVADNRIFFLTIWQTAVSK